MTDRPLIFASARMDDLKARAEAGDARAIAILWRLLPADLPPAELLRQRDAEIRRLAAWLCDALSDIGPSPHKLALILSGDRVAAESLDRAVQKHLRAEIDTISQWVRWPGSARQIETIIAQ